MVRPFICTRMTEGCPVGIEPITKNTALADKIANQILSLIKEKHFLPGDKLPQERELAELLKVSRPSLREALRTLSIMKVIEVRQGVGTFVSSLEMGKLLGFLDFVLSLDESTAEKLFEARKLLEIGIAELAARRISEDQLKELDRLMERLIDAKGDREAFVKADIELHKFITEAAGNPMLSRFMESISQLGLASRRHTVRLPTIFERSTRDHQKIVQGLKRRSSDEAREAMRQHLENVEKAYRDLSKPKSKK